MFVKAEGPAAQVKNVTGAIIAPVVLLATLSAGQHLPSIRIFLFQLAHLRQR